MSNLLALVVCQAVFMSTSSLMVTVGTLAGHALAADKALAALPATATVVGTALAALPASHLSRRLGRRHGFLLGAALAVAGGALGASVVTAASFALLLLGAGLVGMSAAFGQLYRFAAADASPPAWRGRAISLVLAGGIVAGFAVVSAPAAFRGSCGVPRASMADHVRRPKATRGTIAAGAG